MIKKQFLTLFFIIIFQNSFCQGDVLWLNEMGGGSGIDHNDIAIDSEGNSFSVGTFSGNLYINDSTSLASPSINFFVTKYDRIGHLIWIKHFSAPDDITGNSIELDQYGNIYILGNFLSDLILNNDTIASTSYSNGNTNKNGFVTKLDSEGTHIWTYIPLNHEIPSGSHGESMFSAMEYDNEDNLVVTGMVKGNSVIGNDTLALGSHENVLIFKISVSGTPQVLNHFKGVFSSSYVGTTGNCLALDSDKNIIIGGRFIGTLDVDTTQLVDNGAQDAFLIKLDSEGNPLWAKKFGGSNSSSSNHYDEIRSVVVDEKNNVYASGFWGNGTYQMVIGSDTLNSNGVDGFYMRFSAEGDPIWAREIGGGPFNGSIERIFDSAINKDGMLVLSAFHYKEVRFVNDTIIGPYLSTNVYYSSLFFMDTLNGHVNNHVIVRANTIVEVDNSENFELDEWGNIFICGISSSSISWNLGGFNMGGSFRRPYCALISSGDLKVSGLVFRDMNNNQVFDSVDVRLPEVVVEFNPGPYYKITDQNGGYQGSLGNNIQNVTVHAPLYHSISSPGIGYHPISSSTSPYDSLDFALEFIPGVTDIRSKITGNNVRPGFNTSYNLSIENIGTELSNGSLSFEHHDSLELINSSIPIQSHVGNVVNWNYDSLLVGETRNINLVFSVAPDVSLLGQSFSTSSSVMPLLTDTAISNNKDTISQVFTSSYDPNYKGVFPKGLAPNGNLPHKDTILFYEVHFQNTGTDTAFNVVITDTMDIGLLIPTIDMIGSSHSYEMEIEGRSVKWIFENIQLPDSSVNFDDSQGSFVFSIRTVQNPIFKQEIKNKVNIYFDINSPIITNETITTLGIDVSVNINNLYNQTSNFLIHPNPTNGIFTVRSNNLKNKIDYTITTLDGRVIRQVNNVTSNIFEVDLNNESNGVYLLRVQEKNSSNVYKVIKQ